MDRGAFEVASAALTAGSSVPYLVAIRRREVRPQRMSWFVFATLSTTAAAVQIRSGASAGAWLAIGSVVGFGAIFGYSMRWGEGGWHWPDRCTLAIAGAGAALLVLDRPLAALLTVVAAEVAAAGLTVHKVSASPATEARASWSIDAVAGPVGPLSSRPLGGPML